jgi:ABC-type enterochelin transport system permease subunit
VSNLLLLVLKILVGALQKMLNPDNFKTLMDRVFDKVEDVVKDSSTQWDDVLVLPIVEALRKALNVPDNNEPEE